LLQRVQVKREREEIVACPLPFLEFRACQHSLVRASLAELELAAETVKSGENKGSGRNWARMEPELVAWPV
jgi:hypothetical protein